MSNFAEVEEMFSILLAACQTKLSESERGEVQSFIDVGEYGLALETIVDIFTEEGKLASEAVASLIRRLEQVMSMEADTLLQRLPTATITSISPD